MPEAEILKFREMQKKVHITIAGSGNYNGQGLISDDVDVDIAGSGNAHILVNNNLKANIAGSGDIYYSGTPETVDTDVAGSGNVKRAK